MEPLDPETERTVARIRRQYQMYELEWKDVPVTGTERATEIALYQLGVGFRCAGRCGLTYFGKPSRVSVRRTGNARSDVTVSFYCARCAPQQETAK